jgi:hypothetical protein
VTLLSSDFFSLGSVYAEKTALSGLVDLTVKHVVFVTTKGEKLWKGKRKKGRSIVATKDRS